MHADLPSNDSGHGVREYWFLISRVACCGLRANSLDSHEFRNEVCVLGWPSSFLAVPHYIILAQLSVRTLSEPEVHCLKHLAPSYHLSTNASLYSVRVHGLSGLSIESATLADDVPGAARSYTKSGPGQDVFECHAGYVENRDWSSESNQVANFRGPRRCGFFILPFSVHASRNSCAMV
jgi:hypothetical protein